jgi:16S rRNA processing protein RimM
MRTRPGAGGRVLARVKGVDTPEAARALMEQELVVPASALPELEPDEYYHRDLLGLRVEDEQGQHLGELVEIHSTGPVDVYTIRGEGEDLYVPALAERVVEVDVPGGRLVVRA